MLPMNYFWFIIESWKNRMGKEENAGYQRFLLYPQCFQKLSLTCADPAFCRGGRGWGPIENTIVLC